MKIGIFTFHCAINYGAVLQAYCLQEYLKSLGHDVYIIDYRPNYLTKPYKTFNYQVSPHLSILENTKAFIRALFTAIIRNKRKKRFNLFINQRLRLIDFETAKHSHFDLLVYGSDQIWNPKITEGYDAIYFGAIDEFKYCKKISYAASVGCIHNISDTRTFEDLLRNFETIGVRERTLNLYLTEQKINSYINLDPVLLINNKQLLEIGNPDKLPRQPYLLLFQLSHDEQVTSYAKNAARTMGLFFIEINSYSESIKDETIRSSLSPEELIGHIINAGFIISSSFHGVALSIAFQKQFCAIEKETVISERIKNLLNELEIKNRLITLNKKIPNETIEYTLVNNRLDILRNESKTYLNKVLWQ